MSSKTITAEVLRAALEKQSEALLKAIAKLIQEHAPAAAEPAKKRRSKKEPALDEDGNPKPKRAPNAWIKFAQRVEQLIRAKETTEGAGKEDKMRTVVVKQFASHLKSQKAYDEWKDDEIVAALDGWEPPAKAAKPAAEGSDDEEKPKALSAAKKKGKKTAAAASDGESESEDEKAPSAAKRGAKKPAAKKKAAESESEAEPPKRKTSAVKPAAKKAADTLFKKWTHEGTEYWRNKRGDVVSAEMDWVGHWDGKKIDESAEQPEDLASAEFEEK
jgi:hypothetical protein